MNTDDDPAALAAGHALGSLTPDEEAAYQAYLARAARDRAEAVDFTDVAGVLRGDDPEVTPTPGLKRRLMAQIAVTPQHAPAADRAALSTVPARGPAAGRPAPGTPGQAGQDTQESRGPGTSGPASERARRRWRRRPLTVMLAAAAAVVIFAGGIATGTVVRPVATPPAASGSAQLAEIVAASDVQYTTSPIAGGGQATVIWAAETGKAALVSADMPAAPPGKTYQLWIMRDGAATPAGLMPGGGQPSWKVLDGPVQAGDTIGVTVEPHGGSRSPTGKPIVLATP